MPIKSLLCFVLFFNFLSNVSAASFDLRSELESVLAALTGYSEIEPGLRLSERDSPRSKQAVRQYLTEILQSKGLSVEIHQYPGGINVLGLMPATVLDAETVLIGAHYDHHRGPGANDNASGVSLVMALVGPLLLQQERNKNFLFVFFDEEEYGLKGARALAAKMRQDYYPLHSVHTIDQMGWDSDGDRAIELELPTQRMLSFYQCVAQQYGFTPQLHRTHVSSTDHHAFRLQGFEAVGITEEYANGDTTPHYHRPSDTYETINFDYLQSTTEFIIDVFAELSSGRHCPF